MDSSLIVDSPERALLRQVRRPAGRRVRARLLGRVCRPARRDHRALEGPRHRGVPRRAPLRRVRRGRRHDDRPRGDHRGDGHPGLSAADERHLPRHLRHDPRQARQPRDEVALAARHRRRLAEDGVRHHRAGRRLEQSHGHHHRPSRRRRLADHRHQVLDLRDRQGERRARGRAAAGAGPERQAPALAVRRPDRRTRGELDADPLRGLRARGAVHAVLRRRRGRAGGADRRGGPGPAAGVRRTEPGADHRVLHQQRHRALRPEQGGALRQRAAGLERRRSARTRASPIRWPRPTSAPRWRG